MIQSISDKDFQRLVQFIKSKYGITLSEKRQLVTSRLSSLLSAEGYTSFSDFVTNLLEEQNPQKIEKVLNRLTTNYTFFMRETEHFDFFTRVMLQRRGALQPVHVHQGLPGGSGPVLGYPYPGHRYLPEGAGQREKGHL